jgi:hypothetical protein
LQIQWGFNFLAKLIQFEMWLFVLGLMFSIFFLMWKQKINLRGLLFEKTANHDYSPQRLQLLLLSLIFSICYLFEVRHNLSLCQALNSPCTMPRIRTEFLFILGASNFAYLWSKLASILKYRRS